MTGQPKIKVLIAEDDVDLSEIMKISLDLVGVQATVVNTAMEFKGLAIKHLYNIMVIDYHLLDQTSEKAISTVRNTFNPNKHTPILIISGALDAQKIKGIAHYIQGALIKPFPMDQLADKIQRMAK